MSFDLKSIKFNGVVDADFRDPRDYQISKFNPKYDKIHDQEFSIQMPELNFILDQGQYGACVGHSMAMCKSILEYKLTNKWVDYDPFVFYGTRYEGHWPGEGMVPGQAVTIGKQEGFFFRRDFGKRAEVPEIRQIVTEFKNDHPELVKQALDHRITGYSFVYTVEDIKRALKLGMPVSAAWTLYDSFYNTWVDGKVPVPNKATETVLGGHQMTIIGWTKNDEWIVINSWGTKIGLRGMYLIPFEYAPRGSYALSDTITPALHKADKIEMWIGNDTYYVDGVEKKFDTLPVQINNRTYIPARFIAEALGASVEWIEETKEVIVRSEEALIKMTIGDKTIYKDGVAKTMDVAPFQNDDWRTMIPMRFLSEGLNCDVEWDEDTKKITVTAQ